MLRPAFAVGAAVFAVGVVLSVVPASAPGVAASVGDAIGSALNITQPLEQRRLRTAGQSLRGVLGGGERAVQ